MKTPLLPSFLLISFLLSAASAEEKKPPIYTDPSTAVKEDPDFSVQGEYVGELDGMKWGVQVIAQGDGKFAWVGYPGGLPGDGWDGDRTNRIKGSGARKDGLVKVTSDAALHYGMISAGEMAVIDSASDNEVATFKRIERKSPTLQMKAPEGAMVLFDGSSVDGWKEGQMTADGLLKEGTSSKETFQDFSVHLEFRTPFMPTATGQGRGNSGFYAQGRYEVQVLDSFGLEGAENECGGIYSVGQPKLNMCFPPLTWQTYDVDFTAAKYDTSGKKTANARITVKHNGIIIHDDIEADHSTTAAPQGESPAAGPIYLQNHGNPVRYRNIWVVKK